MKKLVITVKAPHETPTMSGCSKAGLSSCGANYRGG